MAYCVVSGRDVVVRGLECDAEVNARAKEIGVPQSRNVYTNQ
jgi:hypothetical protein